MFIRAKKQMKSVTVTEPCLAKKDWKLLLCELLKKTNATAHLRCAAELL